MIDITSNNISIIL